MNADMSTEAADMVVLAVDKYIPTQNWEVSLGGLCVCVGWLFWKMFCIWQMSVVIEQKRGGTGTGCIPKCDGNERSSR